MNYKNFFKGIAIAFTAVLFVSACTKPEEGPDKPAESDSLSVTPDKMITFEANTNLDYVLKIKTNVKEWDYKAPKWVTAKIDGSTLVLNVEDNETADERIGRIQINAGQAEPVKINVKQFGAEFGEDGQILTGPAASFKAVEDRLYAFNREGVLTVKVKMTIPIPNTEEMKAEVVLDPQYLEEYKYISGKDCELLPIDIINLGETPVLTIPAGSLESNELVITCTAPEGKKYGKAQLIPLTVKPIGNTRFSKESKRVNVDVMKQNTKTIKNVVYYEVNDTNPLNTLEYVLEDGTPFIDAVILFAANIRWDNENKYVYLHNNKNVQALLNETDTFLQPLREKGIKVYLGLLGDHTAAGLCNLSDWGAQQYAREVARCCKRYKLDGVNLDDEYGAEKTAYDKKWFTKNDQKAGSRLCYELKKALAEECDWPTEVSYFAYGALWGANAVVDQETGVEHQPKDFIDFYVGNYNSGSTSPYGGLTKQNCCGVSIECNLGYGADTFGENSARSYKEQGYGWVMWFAFDPAIGSHIYNGTGTTNLFKKAARGMYDMELLPPKGYYKKTGPGKYDPTLYPFE